MKDKKYIVAFLCMLLCTGILLTGCGNSNNETNDSGTKSYTIEVKTEGNMALSDVGVFVYKDKTLGDTVCVKKTDALGKITFDAEIKDGYVAVLKDVPAGYSLKEYYELKNDTTEIVLKTELLPADNLSDTTFKLGDAIKDFSLTTSDGTVCKISDLLKEKKAVVLNFWYLTCEPCKMEFPYLQEAYEQYKDDLEVVAMNPVNTDDGDIAEFKEKLGITFYMAQCSPEWEKAMNLTAYPTTVVIDRYGVISLIHRGKFDDTESVEAIFEYYTSDEYSQTIVKDIDDIIQQK